MPRHNPDLPEPQKASQPLKYRLDSRLVRGLSSEEEAEFADAYKKARLIRDATVKVLTNELESAILKSESEEVLKSVNPLAILSDLTGYRRGLRHAISLLTNQESK